MGPFLVVAPLSTIHNWRSEVKKWCPSMDAIVYHGSKAERQELGKKWFQPKFNSAMHPYFKQFRVAFCMLLPSSCWSVCFKQLWLSKIAVLSLKSCVKARAW